MSGDRGMPFWDWSQSASGNSSAGGFTMAEGMAPSAVNDSLREMMAQLRQMHVPNMWGWVYFSGTASVASQTTVKIAGDQTAHAVANRKVQLRSAGQIRTATILSSSFTSETTITLTSVSGSLSASQTLIGFSAVYGDNLPDNIVGGGTVTFTNTAIFESTVYFKQTASFSAGIQIQGVQINYGQNRQTGSSYVLQTTDAGKIVEFNSGSAQVPIVPNTSNVSIPIGSRIGIVQIGAGAVSVSASTGVTINSYSSFKKLLGQYAGAELYHTSVTNTWVLIGQLTS